MKILYLTNHLNTGGITRYLLELCSAMSRRGHEVFVASGGGELESDFLKAGARCLTMPFRTKCEFSPGVLFGALRSADFVKKNNIQLVHCNTRVTQVAGCIISRICKVAYVSTCHGFFKPRISRSLLPCWGERVIAISAQVKEHLVNDLGQDIEKIIVINHGINAARFSPGSMPGKAAARAGFALPENALIVGIIARLSDVKGHEYLVRAFEEVAAGNNSAFLWIIGQGPMGKDLAALVRGLKLENKVKFTPAAADTAAALAAMDVFVMPSINEGLGLALMEAMAAGLAVAGSCVGGIKTLIRDGVNGTLVPPADARKLALAINDLLQDTDKRKKFGREAKKTILEDFAFEKMIDSTEKVYAQCLKNAPR